MSMQDPIYQALAARFVNYQQLMPIPCIENGEAMRDVADFGLNIDLQFSALEPSTGEKLYLRQNVCERLVAAEKALQTIKPGYRFALVYAYRSMAIQRARFAAMKAELGFGDRLDPKAMESTHHFIAVPDVAGHPTGGAIDLLIIDDTGRPLDFGTTMHALERTSYAYSPYISDDATLNRKLLRLLMSEAGFAPYDGEWWHFSYGDREWAAYYQQPQAFYTQLDYDGDRFN